ncbi:outer membrane protein/peptidoglycan-associated (lipo)protein [Azospira oryzae PS]|uniref:Outer membrane protein/peptidoglycan-associated (Lipo)protein n=1 Tax=Azospira oryzae (strain ATCC BAA-33 / DSM 13638 / PS) TaxID=640081 RepID=G8QHF6_AZOOP|nr:OmpA family protein [Azospira oryzae]AEV27349.1 outer membrane protein/peptidoglycan-associated (lipo)protein [Azospira oryzae PS]
MIGLLPGKRRARREEGEKPFWISFSDLMSGLMVLFLVAMTVALLAVTHEISESEREKTRREEDIREVLQRVRDMTRDFPGVTLRGQSVDFGERARFDTNSHKLSAEQARLLRQLVPKILALARDPVAGKWLKQIVVEGFADARGSYLYNLNLSLQRSERVLCALLASPAGSADALSETDQQTVRELFLVGGSSFNFQKASAEESRRIELRLEFRDLGERTPALRPRLQEGDSRCPLDAP